MYITSFFTNAGAPEAGLTPKISVEEIEDGTLKVNAANMTAATNITGFYYYDFAAYDGTKHYMIYIDGGAVLANYERYKYGSNDFGDLESLILAVTVGSGAIEWTYTLTTSVGTPIGDADVWVTSDEAGTHILASGRTDQFGVVTFHLDAGTVYVWSQKTGYNFSNPDTEVVS